MWQFRATRNPFLTPPLFPNCKIIIDNNTLLFTCFHADIVVLIFYIFLYNCSEANIHKACKMGLIQFTLDIEIILQSSTEDI